ncbi:zinc ribbon domain-containing protein [Mycoplasmatota bacterium]|nr:zinc ribbon domain-containing protein [Mycoplasmatota bacterium]
MKRCVYCGRESKDSDQYCKYCGEEFNAETYSSNSLSEEDIEVIDGDPKINQDRHREPIRCPNCQSTDIFLLTKESSGFDGSNACCGYIIFGPLGLLCGLSGARESMTVRKCKNCGHEF